MVLTRTFRIPPEGPCYEERSCMARISTANTAEKLSLAGLGFRVVGFRLEYVIRAEAIRGRI